MQKELSPMETMDLIQSEIDRIKNNQTDLYALDRKRSESMAHIEKDVAESKIKIQNMETDIQEVKSDVAQVKKDMATKEDLKQINESIKHINEKLDSRKWQPKDTAAIVTALLSLIGVIFMAIANNIGK